MRHEAVRVADDGIAGFAHAETGWFAIDEPTAEHGVVSIFAAHGRDALIDPRAIGEAALGFISCGCR